jgi:hypothetical protein
MSMFSQFVSAVSSGEHKAASAIAGAATKAGDAAAGQMKSILNRLPGGLKLGSKLMGGARTPSDPFTDDDLQAPHPGDFPINYTVRQTDGGSATMCGSLDAWGGSQAFPLVGTVALAAGSQTQGTDIVDFHAAASNPTWITTSDLIPGNVQVWQMHLSLAARLVTTLGFEGIGFFSQWWVIEYIQGVERARWSVHQLAAMIGQVGILTSGAASSTQPLNLPGIPWKRAYDPNIKAKTSAQISVTTTTVSVIDCTMAELGTHA